MQVKTIEKKNKIKTYITGGEFFRMLQKQPKKRLPENAVKFYSAEVLLALEYLHFKGFIYRFEKKKFFFIFLYKTKGFKT